MFAQFNQATDDDDDDDDMMRSPGGERMVLPDVYLTSDRSTVSQSFSSVSPEIPGHEQPPVAVKPRPRPQERRVAARRGQRGAAGGANEEAAVCAAQGSGRELRRAGRRAVPSRGEHRPARPQPPPPPLRSAGQAERRRHGSGPAAACRAPAAWRAPPPPPPPPVDPAAAAASAHAPGRRAGPKRRPGGARTQTCPATPPRAQVTFPGHLFLGGSSDFIER
ncbi:uncharacterized protein LOC126336513 [Schistocerca gregaria]|uniref:uncharacterized protein LOC126336513 n=1 Tax=Schistocerca gregaria TaxID=7010 RepID=UPI00211E3336|nr:uncharacterized protein LOC126336513 [Schistocerca gregaria]